jgi:hypothetical protein
MMFRPIAPQGFGDRQNSWAWSMEWFQGRLYVGTMRSYECVYLAAFAVLFPPAYPSRDPDISCAPDYRDLPLQAEIWSWTPGPAGWARVFHSPNDVPIPGTSKFTARDTGFRGMFVHREQDGSEALYVGACSARLIYPSAPAARLLRSVDGVHFVPVPQTPGTFLGDLTYPCFRGITSLNGKLYILATDFSGRGVVIESADPKLGGNSFRQITPAGSYAYEAFAYNGSLYVTFVHNQGFRVYRTSATGPLPYTFVPIMIDGGYKEPTGNPIALSMTVFNNRLYIGGNSVRASNAINCRRFSTMAALNYSA